MFKAFPRRKTSQRYAQAGNLLSEKGKDGENGSDVISKDDAIKKKIRAKTSKKRLKRALSQPKIPPLLRGIPIPGLNRSRSMNGGNRVSTPPPGFRPASPFINATKKSLKPRSNSPLPFHPDSVKPSTSTSLTGTVRFRGELSRMGSGSNLTMVVPKSSKKKNKKRYIKTSFDERKNTSSAAVKKTLQPKLIFKGQSATTDKKRIIEDMKLQPPMEQDSLSLSGVSQIQFTEGKDIVQASNLRQADLSGKHISDTVGENIIKTFEGSSTEDLYLYCNKLSTRSCRSLAKVFVTTNVMKTVLLARNNISDEGAMQLATGLRSNKTLKCLGLDFNQIGNKGAQYLAESLKKNHTLQVLDLDGNIIGCEGAFALSEALAQNTSLKELGLVSNYVRSSGIKEIERLLSQSNTSLQLVSIENNPGTDIAALQSIKSLLKRNAKLKRRSNRKRV